MDGNIKFWILTTFIFGGTSLWQVTEKTIDLLRNRKRNRIETQGAQNDVDDKEFETMRKQLEFQDKRLDDYERRMREKEEMDDRLREDLIALKREKYELENKYLKLERRYAEKESQIQQLERRYQCDACLDRECTARVRPENQNRE